MSDDQVPGKIPDDVARKLADLRRFGLKAIEQAQRYERKALADPTFNMAGVGLQQIVTWDESSPWDDAEAERIWCDYVEAGCRSYERFRRELRLPPMSISIQEVAPRKPRPQHEVTPCALCGWDGTGGASDPRVEPHLTEHGELCKGPELWGPAEAAYGGPQGGAVRTPDLKHGWEIVNATMGSADADVLLADVTWTPYSTTVRPHDGRPILWFRRRK